MAKTLVGLYNTLTDAQHVAHDLVTHDFSRHDIQVAVAGREARYDEDPYIGDWIVADEGLDLVDTLVDVGVPLGEASSYAEGIRRGGALVVVDASDEDADRGLVIMNRLQPVDLDERTTQWRQEGWAGSASHAASSTTATQARAEARQGSQSDDRRVENQKEVTIPVVEEELSVGKREVDLGTTRTTKSPDFSTYATDYRQHHSMTFPNRGAYEDYVPAYRYGYDLAVAERYRGRMWEGLEADFQRGWETQRPGTWERFKDAIRHGWDTVRGRV